MSGDDFEVSRSESIPISRYNGEASLRQLADAMPQIVWVADATGQFSYCNSSWCDVTGFDPSAARDGHDVTAVIHPDDVERWSTGWLQAKLYGTVYELEYRMFDARARAYRWYACRTVPLRDSLGAITQWVGTATDIHDRKIAELAIVESEKRLRERDQQLSMIFETGTMGNWTWDIEADQVCAHPMVWALYGSPDFAGPASSSWFAARQHSGDIARIEREMQKASQSDGRLDFEFRVVHPDGSLRWISLHGVIEFDQNRKPIQTHGLNIDITARKMAEVRLQESELQLRRQADAMPQIVWHCTPDGNIDYYNHRWYEYTGAVDGSPIDQSGTSFVHPDDLARCRSVYGGSFAAGEAFEVEFRLRRASDGAYRWHLARGLPFRGRDGDLLCWFGTSTDVHQQKTETDRLEREVQARTNELSESLSEKETLLKEIHHRVKNNLQVISSLLDLQAATLDDPAGIEALKESQQRVMSMAMIHQRLYGGRKMDRIDFGEYSRELVRDLFNAYRTDSHVTSKVCASSVILGVDQAIPTGLILNELVTNALKYAYPAGRKGEVTIDLREATPGNVKLTVSDQGVGLADGFDWTASKSLGLNMVSILATQIGGSLTVSSSPGASFSVEFPVLGL